MPTTPNGTQYTITTIDIAGHGKMVYGLADSLTGAVDIPFVFYAHGSEGPYNQFATSPAWDDLRNWLIDNGWGWYEGSLGGTRSWGNLDAQYDALEYTARIQNIFNVGIIVLLGRSMGGLVTAWLYAKSPIKDRFSGWISNSGVSTLFTGITDGTGTMVQKSSGRRWEPIIWDAYGAETYAEFEANAYSNAPEFWDESVWVGKKILNCYGTADQVVPWYPRGGSALRDIWVGLPDVDDVSPKAGGDHSASNGSYDDVPAMAEFLSNIGGGATPPVNETGWKVERMWRKIGDTREEITFRP